MKFSDIVALAKETFSGWSEDKASRLAAALAYYTVFSIPPLLIITLAIAGIFLDEEAARGQIVGEISGLVGQDSADAIETMIQNASQPGESVAAAVIGVVVLLFGASGVFGQLHDALNTIWEVEPKPGRGILGTIKDRFLSFTMVLGIAFLLLVSLVISAALAALDEFVVGLLPGTEAIMQVVSIVISFAVTTLLFALVFKVVPDAEIAWRDVWIGAAITALLFTIGRTLIGLYLGRSETISTYGAAGSLVLILLWVYYSAQILFLGAEFTQVYANKYGSRIRPDEDAVPVTEEARAQQGMASEESVAAAAAGHPAPGSGPAQVPDLRRQPAMPLLTAGTSHAGADFRETLQYATIGLLALVIGIWRWLRS
jgi:membrane protein